MPHVHGDIEIGDWRADGAGGFVLPVTMWYDPARETAEQALAFLKSMGERRIAHEIRAIEEAAKDGDSRPN